MFIQLIGLTEACCDGQVNSIIDFPIPAKMLARSGGSTLVQVISIHMTDPNPARSYHDMGGLPAGAIEPTEHDYALWEKRVDALMMLLSGKDRRLVTVDELRRNIESLGPDAYDKLSYYERWIFAITQTLIQRGVLTVDELGRKIKAVQDREERGG
jgi:hypothetical protein